MKNISKSIVFMANSLQNLGGGNSQSLANNLSFIKVLRISAMLLLLCLGVGQMGAWWYVPSNIYSEINFNTTCTQMTSDNYLTYYCVPAGTYQFKLAVDDSGTADKWGNGALTNGTPSIITSLISKNTSYSDGGTGYNNTITVNQTCNIIFHMTDGKKDGTWACTVTAGAPTLPIRANFNNGGDWVWKTMQSNGDGTVSVKGLYGSCSGYNIRRTSREVEASWSGQYITTNISTSGSTPAAADNCVFTYDPSNGLAANASLTIRKCNTVSKPNYIYFDNTDAAWDDTYLYFVIGHAEYSKMYRIQQISHTNLWYAANDADDWSDGSYYALAGGGLSASWDGGTGWGYPSLLAWNHHTAAYLPAFNLVKDSYYMIEKDNADNGGAITLADKGKTYTMLNFNVGYKYNLHGDDVIGGNTPAQISMTSYYFSNRSTTAANATQTISANTTGTYSKTISAAYRGEVGLTMSNLSDGYKFIGWYEGNTEKKTTSSYTYYPKTATTVTAKFDYRWSLKGTMSASWDDDIFIGDFAQNGSGEDVGYKDLTLEGNTNYNFKIYDRSTGSWYSFSNDESVTTLTYADNNGEEQTCGTGTGYGKNSGIRTAAPGTYRFKWNADTKKLTVTYPDSYLVTYDDNGSTDGSVPTDADYYASGATVTVKGNDGSLEKSNYGTLAYWTTEDGGTDYAIGSGTFTISDNTTLYARWTQSISLNNQKADSGKGGTSSVTVSYNYNTNMTSAITKPQKTGQIFSGYYTLAYGSGDQIIDANGEFTENVTNYITGGIWTRSGAAPTLYAYWKNECSASAYTFRYFNTGTVAYESACFEQVGSTNEWNVVDFAIPSQTNYSVGYNEDVYASELGEGNGLGVKSSSVSQTWTASYAQTEGIGNGAMQLLPAGVSARAVGQATGALGTLVIWDNTADKNLSVGFLPNGYGVTTADRTCLFTVGDGYFCYTNPITITSTEASGNFQVMLTTSDGYAACAQGAAENASAVNARKITGDANISNGKKGVFQMWQDATANNFGLRFVTVHNVSFDMQGHGSDIDDYVDVRYNDKIVAPDEPSEEYYTFGGWYKEAGCTNAWNFASDVVTGTTTLHAKWTETPYTVTTSATAGGTVGAANYTGYVASTTAISATPSTGYKFSHWSVVSGSVTFANYQNASTTITATSDATIKANFVLRYAIAGNWLFAPGSTTSWDSDTNLFDDVTKDGDDDVCSVSLTTLEPNTSYSFSVVDRGEDGTSSKTWLQHGTSRQYITYTTDDLPWEFGTSPTHTVSCGLNTAGAGTYTFTWNITQNKLSVTFPESYYVTMAMNPSTNSSTISPASGYMSTSQGATITATPDYAHYFNGWTSSSGGTFENASSAETTFTPSATTTVTAALPERTAFIEGNIHARNSEGTIIFGEKWENISTALPMEYDAANNRYYLHTYSTPAELRGNDNAMFLIKTSTSSSSLTNVVQYGAAASPWDNHLYSAGSASGLEMYDNNRGYYIRGSEEANVILYFDGTKVWYETEQKTFTDASEDHKWSTASNWSPSGVPTIVDIVYITKPVTVDVTDAVAKRIIIDQTDDNTGKLQIGAAKKLVVAQTIQVDKGEGPVATTSEDLLIGSSSSGNGALVWGTASTTPGDAQVEFYTKSGGSKNSTASVNQFIGTPFQSHTNWVYNYDNSWLLNVDYSGAKPVFDLLARGQDMNPFEGYCIIYNGDPGNIYEMTGTLVTNADHTCSSLSYKSGDGGNSANENLLANSWLAPIRIAAFESSDFVKTDATIYIFNAGSKDDKDKGEATKGQYSTYPIGSAGDNVIPSMQSFSVYTNASGGSSVTLDYSKLVYAPAVAGTAAVGPNKAPQRTQAEMNKVRLYVRGDKGFGDMVYMLEDENFTPGFDNCWDGRKMFGESFAPQMFALSEDGNMAVNAVPDFDGTLLGFKAGTEDSQYTITFDYEGTDYLYLYDMQTAEQTLISNEASYTFTSSDKEAHNRFIINKAPKVATGVENGELLNGANGVRKVLMDNHLYIIRDGRLFNATGALVK